jgi:oligopeptide transport system substrate-binding protein
MKWFYFLSLAVVAMLVAMPLFILRKPDSRTHTAASIVYNAIYNADVKSLDPATCGDVTSSTIQANFYEGMYVYHYLKRPVEVVEQLADGMPEVSADGLTYTIRIKKDILYHRNPCFGTDPSRVYLWNTRTVTAGDFVLAFKRVADYHINTGLAWAFLADRILGLDEYREKTRQYRIGDFSRYDLPVEGIVARDSLTLVVRLKAPFPQFIYVLSMGHVYGPIAREVIDYHLSTASGAGGIRIPVPFQDRNPEIMEQEQVVGTGPYILKTFKRKWEITLVHNPEFRKERYPSEGEGPSRDYPGDSAMGLLADAGKRVPFIDEINFRYVEEEYAAWMLFLSRQVDVAGIPVETFQAVITPSKELTDSWRKKHISLSKASDPIIYWIVFNMEDPVLGKSKALRQAISLGYDVENEIKILSNGRGFRAVNVVPASFKGHTEAGPGPYFHYDTVLAEKKISEAKKDLAAAGLLANGEIPELKFDMSDGPMNLRMADFARQQFARLGLKLKCIFNDWPTLQRKVQNKQIQMYYMGWAADYPDAEDFLQLFYSKNIDKGTNNSNYKNPVFDSLYEKIRVMPDTPERTGMYVQMIRIISEDCVVMPIFEPESFTLYYDWMRNIKQHPVGYGFLKYRRIDPGLRRLWTGSED